MVRLEIVIPADLVVIRKVTEGVGQLLRDKPGVIGHEVEIALALREALANAIRHDAGAIERSSWSVAPRTSLGRP